jgi:hypothetical protein
MDQIEVDQQKTAIKRIERLLDRSQREPHTTIGDSVIINELLSIRNDLLEETQRRQSADSQYVLRHEFEPIKRGVKWLLATGTSTLLLAFSWWLGTRK